MSLSTINIFSILIAIIFIIILIPLFRDRIKLSKNQKLLDEQDKKLKEIADKQKDSEKYKDFTDGHMYQ